jgi:cell division protein FtsQ
MGRVHGVNIFKLDIDKIEAALLKHPWVKEVNVYRRLSRTIEVVINEWVPKAIVHLGHLYFVDSNGVLFKRVDEEEINLPVITGISSRLYKKSPRRFQQIVFQAFRLIEAFKELDRGVLSEVHYKVGSGWSLYTIDGIALYLGEGNYKEKLKVLNMYFNHFLSLDQELRYVYIQKASPWRFIVGYKNKINIKEEREEP